jgi:lipopolysaccharide export system permease protein
LREEDHVVGQLFELGHHFESLKAKLIDGSVFQRDINRPGFSQTRFNIYDFKLDLDELIGPVRKKSDGPKELPFGRLIETIRDKRQQGQNPLAERIELHQRVSLAFVPLVFCLLGVSLTLLPHSARAGRSWGFLLCLFWLLAYYLLLSLGKALGEQGTLHPALALWLPNVVVGGIALHFFMKASRESPLALMAQIDNAFSWASVRFGKVRQKA